MVSIRVAGRSSANNNVATRSIARDTAVDVGWLDRVIAARQQGIYVSIMLFEDWVFMAKRKEHPVELHPFHKDNNINGINGGLVQFQTPFTAKDAVLYLCRAEQERTTMNKVLGSVGAIVLLFVSGILDAAEPADRDLIPEARAVLNYLKSVYGQKMLAGISGTKNAEAIRGECGKDPAIMAIDLSGWNTPTWGRTYTPVVQNAVNSAKACCEQGSIVGMQFHWKHPMKPDGTAWVGKHGNNPPSGPYDMAAATRPGTPQRKAFLDDLAIYPNSYYGWGKPQEDTYQKAFDIMRQVTPNKMLALCEGEAIPNPDLMAAAGPKWLYCLPWWGPGKNHPADWIKQTYQHDLVITRDELPNWTSAGP